MNNKINLYTRPFPRINSYKEMIDTAVDFGLNAVEGFNVFEFKTPDIEMTKKIKEYADIKGVCFPCFSMWVDLTGENYKEQIEKVKKYAEVASILGSGYLHHTITPECFDMNKILKYKENHLTNGISAVREIFDYSESLGIKTIYEDQGFVFNGVEGFGEFLDKVNRNVGIVADFGNIYQSKNNIEEFIKAFKNRICHVHIKDIAITDSNVYGDSLPSMTGKFANEVEIGTGTINFKKCFDILKDAGYNGHFALEYGAKSDESDSIKSAIEKLNIWLD